jgi:Transcriptional regulator
VIDLSVRDKVYQAAEQLAASKPFDLITFAEVAQQAEVHWTAVRRHFGSKQKMREWFKERQAGHAELAGTKSRVLEAAAHVFAAHGYTNSSLDKVAEHAGLSKGAVYWHFSSKQDLFLAILERNYEQQLRFLPGQMERILSSDNADAALADWLEAQFMCLEFGEDSSMLFLDFLVSGREADIRAKLQKQHGKMMDEMGTLFQEMQRRGYFAADVDPRSAAVMVDALLKGVLVEWMLDPRPDALRTLISTISRTLWQGLRGGAQP